MDYAPEFVRIEDENGTHLIVRIDRISAIGDEKVLLTSPSGKINLTKSGMHELIDTLQRRGLICGDWRPDGH